MTDVYKGEKMKNYIEQAMRTESSDLNQVADRMVQSRTMRLQHAAMGLVTEAGEFTDALKKHVWYGKPLDKTNLKEEIGDILWYLAIACDALSTDFDTEMERNINKLRARYPDKFCDVKAVNRDLDAERVILDSKVYGTPVLIDDTNGMEIIPEVVSAPANTVADIDQQMAYIINQVNVQFATSKQRRFVALLDSCKEVFGKDIVDSIDVVDDGRKITTVTFRTASGQDPENIKGYKWIIRVVNV